ncbi:uncharacterized protein LOC124412314 isoform X2 [Diprion similis]|uniref:uncharacterized protein LOC124412314 isoform X2 n=1 Tax=Diprion similis TaxID=362088 RepID=UPI001EF96F1A|nr:uncharacterized protein LOC124412314 isoform X2 [Diprion similis]
MNIDIRGVDYMLFQGTVDAGLTGDVQNALCVNQKQTDPAFDKVVDEPLTSSAYEKTTGIVPSERPKSRFKSSVVLGSIDATTLLEENNGQSVEFDDNVPFDGLLAISAMEENEEYIQNVSNTQDLLDKEGNDFTFFKKLHEDQKFRYDSNHSLSSTGYETLEMIDDDVNNSLDSLRQKLDEGSSENLHNAKTSNMKFNFESKWNDVSNNRQIKTDNITDSTKSHHESEIESNSDFVNKKYVILLDASDDEDGDDNSIVNFLMANRDMLNTNKLEQEDETLQLIAYRQTFHLDDQSTCRELRKQNSSEINDLSPVSAKNSTSQNLPTDEFGSVNTTILDYNQNFNETYTVSISTSNKKTKQMVTFSTNDSESASGQDKKELHSCNRRPEALKMSENQNTKSNSDFRNNCATIHSFNEETSLQSMNLFQPHSSCENHIQDIDNRIKMEVGRVSLNSNTSYSVKKNVTDSLKTATNQRKSCDITSRRRRTSHQSFRRYTRSTTMPLMKAKNFPMLCMRNASVVRKRYSMQTSRKLSAFRKLRKLNQKVFADSIRMRAFEDSNYTKVSNKSESIERSCIIDLPVADTKDVFKTNVNNDSGILKSRNLLEKQMNKNPTSEQQFANSIAGCTEMKLETVINWTESTDDSTSDCTTAPTIKIEVESDDEAEDSNVDMLHFMLLKEMWSNKNANEQLDISETYLEQNELFVTLLKEFLNKKNCSMYIPQLTGIDKFLKERNINIVTAGTHNNIVSQKKAYPSKSDADTFSTKTAFTKSFESLDANIKSNSNHSRSLRKQTTVSDVPYLEDEKFLYRHDMSSMRKNLSPVPTPTFNDDLKIEKPNCECSMQDEVHVKTEFCNVNYCEQYDTASNVMLSMHKIYDANETSTVKSEMENFEDEMDIDETKEIIFPEGIGSMNLPFNCKCSENFIYGTHIGTACDAVQKYSCNCNESQDFDCKDLDNSSGVTKSQYSSYTYSVRKSQRLECPRNQISQPVVKLEIMDPENCRAQPTVILKERRKKSGHQDSCRTLPDKKRRVKRALQHSAKRKLEPQECISARTRSRCTRSSKNSQTQIQHSSDPLARQKRKRPKNSTAIESRCTKRKARRTRRVSASTQIISGNEHGKNNSDMEIIERTSECSVNQSPRKNIRSTKRKLRPRRQNPMKDEAHEPIIHRTKSKHSMESKILPNLQLRIADQISDICKANKDNIARNNRTKDMSKSLVKTKGEKNIPRILKRNAKPSNSKNQMETDQQSIDGENTVHLTYQVLRSTLQKTHPIGNDKAVSTEKDSTVLSTNGYTSDTSNNIQGEKEISEEPVETTETVENIRAPTINLCNDLYTRYFTNFITASGYKVKFCYVNRRLAVLNAVIANADEADSFVKAFSQFDCANYNVWRDTKQGRYILHRTWLCGINGSQDPDVNYKNLSCQARIHISVDNPTTHDFNAHVLIYKEHTHYSANKEQLLRIIPL